MEDMNSYEDSNVWILKNKFILFFIPVSIVLDVMKKFCFKKKSLIFLSFC